MWACAKGHHETAITLFKFNHNALKVKNKKNRYPIEVARDNSHDELANDLERHEAKRRENDPPQLYSSSFLNHLQSANSSDSTTVTTEICSNYSAFNTSIYEISTSKLLKNIADESSTTDRNTLDNAAELLSNSKSTEDIDNPSPKSVESQSSNRSHDGVFLRPGAVSTR